MNTKVKRPTVTIEAVVTRANGKVENLGVVSEKEKITVENKKILKEDKNNGRCSTFSGHRIS